MIKPIRVQFLSTEERERIYKASLDILRNVGVKTEDPILIKNMRRFGCQCDDVSMIVKIPLDVVKQSFEIVNKSPVLKCCNGKELRLEGNNRYYGSLVIDPFILDYKEGPRKARLEDVARHARLGDALGKIDQIYKMDESCSDVDLKIVDLKTIEAFVSNTTTSYFCAPSNMESAKTWIEISEIMAGGSLDENPILCAYIPIISPLFMSRENSEELRYCLDKGVILRCGPCPIAGATAPFTIAGTLTQSLAEILFQLVAIQSLKPGATMLTGIGGHPLDMKTGTALYGGPIKDILHIGAMELCDYLGLPVSFGVFSTLCRNYELQNGIESSFSAFFTFFVKNHIMGGMGSLGNACGMSPEQVLIHHDIIETLERYDLGIDVNEETIALNSIYKIGPHGEFLTDDLTVKYLRTNEHYLSELHEVYAPGVKDRAMIEKVHEKVEDIISSHRPVVDEYRVEQVKKYVKDRIKQIIG